MLTADAGAIGVLVQSMRPGMVMDVTVVPPGPNVAVGGPVNVGDPWALPATKSDVENRIEDRIQRCEFPLFIMIDLPSSSPSLNGSR